MLDDAMLSIIGAVAASSAGLAWFISEQFRRNRQTFYKVMSVHNKEDDDRFESINNQIWQLRLRNARKDGEEPPEYNSFPRRRYLIDEQSG